MTYDLTLSRFKGALARGETPVPGLLRKAGIMAMTQVNDRQVQFTISTAAVDRDNDTVAVEGWDLSDFLKNPVVLWAHDSSQLPIGKCVAIGVEGGQLQAVVDFVPLDMPVVGPQAEAIMRMCRDGFLSATSVGFMPTAYTIAADRTKPDDWYPGLNFTSQTLLEFSVCAIPSNPEALIDPSERRSLPHLVEEILAQRAHEAELDRLAASVLADRQARLRAYRAACI